MNIEDLKYQLVADDSNVEILDKKIAEYENIIANRKTSLKLVGEPDYQEELKKLKEERQKYAVQKNLATNLIGAYNIILKNSQESTNVYSKYTIDDFQKLAENLKKSSNDLEEQIVNINSILAERKTSLKLVGEPDYEQVRKELIEKRNQTVQNFQRVSNIIGYYKRMQTQLEDIKSLKENNLSEYLTRYHEIIYKANAAKLPEKLIVDSMRSGLDNKLTDEEKDKLRQKLENNIKEIQARKAEAKKAAEDAIKSDPKFNRGRRVSAIDDPNDVLLDKLKKNAIVPDPTSWKEDDSLTEDEIIKKKLKENKTEQGEEDKKDLNKNPNKDNNGNTSKFNKRANYESMSVEKLNQLLDKLKKEREKVDKSIVKIDLNADLDKESWERNTFDSMGDYIYLSNEINLVNEVINSKIKEENQKKKKSNEKDFEAYGQKNVSAFGNLPLTTGSKRNEWIPQGDTNNIENNNKQGNKGNYESSFNDDFKNNYKDNSRVESDLYSLKKTWENNSIFKRAFAKVKGKTPNWEAIRNQLEQGESYNSLEGGMHL